MATTLAAKSGSRGSTCTSSKFWLVMVVMMLTFMCSGVIYGWTGMLLILRKEGVYQHYSEGEQEEKFDLIMTIASFFTAGSGLFIGVFLDAFGPRITALCSGVITIAGCFVFGFQWNLTVGYAMFAVGGMGILISSFRAAYLFPAHQSLVIGSISCLFDSSTVIFVVFDVLYENFGLTLKQLCMGYAAICVVLQIALFALWSMNPTFDRLQAKAEEPDEAKSLLDVATRPAAVVDSDDDDDDGDASLVAELPFKQQLRTAEFVFIYIFCCVMMFRSNLFLGTAGNFLISLGDDKDGDRYAKLLASIIPLGFIFVPVISYFLDRTGFAVSAYMVVVIGLAYGGLSIVPILEVQLGTAFMFTFYRAALFSFVAAFNAKIFGPASVGRVTGILYTTTAALIVLQYPATTLTVDTFHNNYQPLHAFLTLCCALMFIDVACVQCYSKEVGWPVEEPDSDSDDEEAGKPVMPPNSPDSHRSGYSNRSGRRRRSTSNPRAALVRSWSLGSEKSFLDAAAQQARAPSTPSGGASTGYGAMVSPPASP